MAKTIKSEGDESKKRIKEVGERTDKMKNTTTEVESVAAQLQAIKIMEYEDVRQEVNAEKDKVVDSGVDAVNQDEGEVKVAVENLNAHAVELDAAKNNFDRERSKAEQIRPKESRIRSGGEIAKIIEQRADVVSDISRANKQSMEEKKREAADLKRRVQDAANKTRSR